MTGGFSASSVRVAWAAALAAGTAHMPCLFNSFQWDDTTLLLRPEIAHLSWRALHHAWTSTLLGHYAPVAWMSWALDLWMGEGAPLAFHATNVLLHAANAGLCVLLAGEVLKILLPKMEGQALAAGALAAGFFFALHPLRVETVAWATERRGLLSAFFGLCAFLCHERGAKPWTAPLLLAAAVLSKETAVAWPPVLTVWAVARGVRRGEGRRLAVLWAVGLMGGAAGLIATYREAAPVVPWEAYGLWPRLVQTFRGFWWALWKTLWPAGLSPFYELRNVVASPARLSAAAAGLGLTAAALVGFRRHPFLSAAWLAHTFFLWPTGGLFQSGSQDTADRYTYAASLPWALVFGTVVARCAVGARAGRAGAALALLAAGAWLGGLTGLSIRQQFFWRTPLSFWRRVASVPPVSEIGLCNLGEAQGRAGAWAEALNSFQGALAAEPRSARAVYGTAAALEHLGRTAEAAEAYRACLALDPSHASAGRRLASLESRP